MTTLVFYSAPVKLTTLHRKVKYANQTQTIWVRIAEFAAGTFKEPEPLNRETFVGTSEVQGIPFGAIVKANPRVLRRL